MTVSSQTNNVMFVGNGVATSFPLPFRFFSNGDIRAYFIDSTTGVSTPMFLGTDYTLIGAGEPEVDGNALSLLTTTVPLANLRGLYVERVMSPVQETDIVNQGEFFAATHEDVFDRLTMLIQQANANSNGAIRVAIGDPEPTRLAPATQRANLLMGFDASGNPVALAPSSGSAADLAISLLNTSDPTKGAGQIGYNSALAYGAGTVGNALRDIAKNISGFVTPQQFGALADGVADDTAAIQTAHDTGKAVFYPAGNYKITAPISITSQGQKIVGSGWGISGGNGVARVFASSDIKLYLVTAAFVHFESLVLDNTAAGMNSPHIHFANDAFSSVDRCRFNAVENFTSTGGGILIDNGAGGIGGSVAVITNININHGSIVVKRSDVHIKNSWLWANSRPYAITASGAVGNLVIEGCDLLPPQTLVAARKAAIYLTGALSAPRILGCNFDGNSSLATGSGLLAENGLLNLLVSGCYGFGHDEDCIILDSIIAPVIIGNTFKNNNVAGNGSVDIRLRDTFAQGLEKPLIDGNAFTQTAAVVGAPGAAIRMDATTSRSGARIINNTIQQPGAGGGYTDIEILLDDGGFTSDAAGTLRGNRGTRSHYEVAGTTAFLNTDTSKSLTYGLTMAYAPRVDQILVNTSSTGAPPGIRFNSASMPTTASANIVLHGTFVSGTLHWNVRL